MNVDTLLQTVERVLFQNTLDWDAFLQCGNPTIRRGRREWTHARVLSIFDAFVNLIDETNAHDIMRAIFLESSKPLGSLTKHLKTLLERFGVAREYVDASAKLLLATSDSPRFDRILGALTERRHATLTTFQRTVATVIQRECKRLVGTVYIL
jgi:hypothetical protein